MTRQLVTYELDEELGTPTKVGLHPNVKYGLGLTQYPPEASPSPPHDRTTEDS